MRDPVCGMTLTPDTIQASTTYLDCQYRFCSPACLQKFNQNPREYLSDSSLGA